MNGPEAERRGPRPDVRLTGLALGTWLAALAALQIPAWCACAVAVVAGSATAGLILGPGRRTAGRGVAAVVLLGTCLGAAATGARIAARDAGPLQRLVRDRAVVEADLVVSDDPRPVRGGAGRPATYVVPARVTMVWTERTRVRAGVRVLVLGADPRWRGLLPGQAVRVSGRLGPPRGGDLRAAVLSANGTPAPLGPPPWSQRIAGRLRAGLQEACAPLPRDAGGLLPGLVVGDTSRLDPALDDDFRTTGLTHLTAVSGSNCAVVVGLVLLSARAARAGPRAAAAVSVLALAGFVVLARPSPSVLRAAAMGTIALVGLASGRPRAALPALGAAVVVLVVVDPELAGAPGFALSVLATAGLLLLAPGWRDALRRRRVPPVVAEAIAVPAAAQAACAPVIAGLSGAVSLVAVPANLLAVPAVAPATVFGVGAAALSPWWPAGARFAAWLAGWPARWLVVVARYGARVPAGELPWPGGVAGGLLLGVLLAVAILAGRWLVVRRLLLVVALAAVLGALPVRLLAPGWPPPGWIAVACDVGQGDAIVLAAGDGAAVVVDAGPDPVAVDRCLRRLGVERVPLLVVSHFHIDHVGGVAGVFRGRTVGTVVTTAFPEPAAGRSAVHTAARAGRAVARAAEPGWRADVGRLRLAALTNPEPLHGTRSDPNNNSLVVRVTVDGHTLLLAADAEIEQQEALLAAYGRAGLRAEVVKLAHHGSAFQDPAFLDAVRPGAALVSVGAGNGYGHPNPSVLGQLVRGGVRVLRTDRDGDVAVVLGRGRVAVVARGVETSGRAGHGSGPGVRASPLSWQASNHGRTRHGTSRAPPRRRLQHPRPRRIDGRVHRRRGLDHGYHRGTRARETGRVLLGRDGRRGADADGREPAGRR